MVADIIARIIGSAIIGTGGWRLGEQVSFTWAPDLTGPLVLALSVAGAALGFVATPFVVSRTARGLFRQLESVPTSTVLSGTLGVVLGLLVALLVSIPLFRISGWAGLGLPIALSITLAYIGAMVLAAPGRDIFQRLVADGSLGPASNGLDKWVDGKILLDTSAIIDGRIAGVSQSGFLRGRLLVPQFILDELRHIADSSNSLRRTRGRRGLELLTKLRQEAEFPIEVLEVGDTNGRDVDSMLVGLAKDLHASIVTTDYNLNRVAQIQGVPVLNVNELANSLRPVVLPGEGMIVRIIQEGKEPGQGVGYLDDGTMVVVEGGDRRLNQDLDVVVTRILQTAAGCIIFGQPKRA